MEKGAIQILWGKRWQFLSLLLLFNFLGGGGSRFLQENDSLETTQMSEYLVITPDLVWVTLHRRTAWMPSRGGVAVS